MIASLRGAVADKNEDYIVVEVGGVGIKIYVPAPLCDSLSIGEQVSLQTHLVVREDSLTLYGF
ncbi:MAG: Holliday junction branch migration protein RuvA, partial [Chloroflexi bacterium]|nr:Holliday junction branch migration protein RuvA [Chloroflexota bacterium]